MRCQWLFYHRSRRARPSTGWASFSVDATTVRNFVRRTECARSLHAYFELLPSPRSRRPAPLVRPCGRDKLHSLTASNSRKVPATEIRAGNALVSDSSSAGGRNTYEHVSRSCPRPPPRPPSPVRSRALVKGRSASLSIRFCLYRTVAPLR